jgi:hypothetical protein
MFSFSGGRSHRHDSDEVDEQEQQPLLTLLGQHYGDGLVYLREPDDRRLLMRAIVLGLVSEDGYLTPDGYRLWRRRLQA